jgi:hypothetical protein
VVVVVVDVTVEVLGVVVVVELVAVLVGVVVVVVVGSVVDVVGVVVVVVGNVVEVEVELDPLLSEATTARATPRPMTSATRSPMTSFRPGLIPPGGGAAGPL